MKQFLIRLLQSSLTSLGAEAAPDAPSAGNVVVAADPRPVAATLKARASGYVQRIEHECGGRSGEWKRHQVLALLLKDFPARQKGDTVKLSRAIDDAVEKL